MKNRKHLVNLPQTHGERSKNWRTLRAVCLLLFLSISFAAYSQITVNLKDLSLRASLKKIEQVSSYKFFYNENLPELDRKVSLNVKNATVEQVMNQLLNGMELTYKQEKDNVLVLLRKSSEKQETKKVTGIVVDEKGEPIIGASVQVKGENNGTITNVDGYYSLMNVPESATLTISYIGYRTVTLPVKSQNTGKVTLVEDSKMIDEVVVVGYGVQRKRDVSTAISSIRASDIADVAATSIEQALVGRMAGVQITQPNGTPGAGFEVKVRGVGTVTAGSSPLYVIDGVPLSDDTGDATGITVSPLASIETSDIESIEVLKDASAAAIYGSRGSNGVVIITTKQGKEGKPVVKYNGYAGAQMVTDKIDVLNAYEYAQLVFDGHNNAYYDQLRTAGKTDLYNPYATNLERWNNLKTGSINENQGWMLPPEILPYVKGEQGLVDTDWQDAVLRTGFITKHNLSVSGGNKNIK